MISLIKNSKLSYAFFNIFNKKKLKHNLPLYKKYNIKKSYFAPISSSNFKDIESRFIRKENPESIRKTVFYKSQTEENQQSLLNFFDKGYSIIRNFITEEQADKVNREIQELQDIGQLDVKYGNKLMFALHKSETVKSIGLEPSLISLLDVLLDGKLNYFKVSTL